MNEPKLQIVITATIEYTAKPYAYPDNSTPEEMLAIDMENSPEDLLDCFADKVSYTVVGKVI